MLFNSLQFAIFLAVIVISVNLFKKRTFQLVLLIAASYFFYFASSGFFFVLLLFSSLLDFYCSKKIFLTEDTKKRRLYLLLSIIGNLGILAFFKYANFTIQIANQVSGLFGFAPSLTALNIILPVGISFFTFQTMSYTIDTYRRKLNPTDSFLKYMLFVAFFPQLIAGPIVRAYTFLPQIKEKILIIPENIKLGLTIISWGIVKKVVFADNIAIFVNTIFANPQNFSSFPIIMAAIAFGVQIYCDFSAYTDIAIGSARILGFKLPKNFDKPYFARNPTEFWRKWHISLSSWLRDYLYIPLGGNRKGAVRTYINLMITMLLGGLWHGASWNFVIWGGYHGLILAIHRFFSRTLNFSQKMCFKTKLGTIFSILITQYFIFFGWLIFRVQNSDYLWYAIKKFLFFDFAAGIPQIIDFILAYKWFIFLIILFFYIHFISYKFRDIISIINSWKLRYWFIYLTFVILLIFLFSPSLSTEFIYFQF